jgi:hypothetical protein
LKLVVLITGVVAVSVFLVVAIPPQWSDWSYTLRPAALALLAGHSPYSVATYIAPPWLLIPLLPLAILPAWLGQVLIFWLTLAAYAFLARTNGARALAIIALLVSYPVVYGLIYSQIDWLVMLGLVLPPWIGLPLLMTKPQVGIGAALFLGYQAWSTGGLKKLVLIFLPLAVLVLVSFALFGPDVFTRPGTVNAPANTSLWPRAIPIGLVLVVAAIRRRSKFFSLTASPFLSPYVAVHSWATVIVGLSDDPWFPLLISAGSWVVFALGGGATNR